MKRFLVPAVMTLTALAWTLSLPLRRSKMGFRNRNWGPEGVYLGRISPKTKGEDG